MFSNSKTWEAPEYKKKKQQQRLQEIREHFCPDSPFWPADLEAHRTAWQADQDRWDASRARTLRRQEEESAAASKQFFGDDRPPPSTSSTPIQPALRGRVFTTPHSAVLCLPTAFTPWPSGSPASSLSPSPAPSSCPIFTAPGSSAATSSSAATTISCAAWPDRPEQKYEGDDRIVTDPLHGRCLPVPRLRPEFCGMAHPHPPFPPEVVENSARSTAAARQPWLLRAIAWPQPLEDFHYPPPDAVEVFLRTHWVEELEVGDAEGVECVGRELMEALEGGDGDEVG